MEWMQSRALKSLLLVALVVACSGASCFNWTRPPEHSTPIMFEATPELGEIIHKINQNTALIRQLESDDVRLTAAGVPTLRAKLAVEAPRRLRLRADFLMSRELDIGSNEEVFWIFSKSGSGALLFSRHDEFARSPAQQVLPVDPEWLLNALGLVTLDPAGQHEGPYAHGDDAMEIRSSLVAPSGETILRRTIIHRTYGWIVQQQLHDSAGRLLASATAHKHHYYSEVSATLPEIVDVVIAPGQRNEMAFQIDVGTYRINQLHAPSADLWVMPAIEGYPHINLADPRSFQQLQPAEPPTVYQPNGYTLEAQRDYRAEYRGYAR